MKRAWKGMIRLLCGSRRKVPVLWPPEIFMSWIKETAPKKCWNQPRALPGVTWSTRIPSTSYPKNDSRVCVGICPCVQEKLDGKSLPACTQWKCCFSNMRHRLNLREESRIDWKLLLRYQRWHHFPLLSCLYKFRNGKKPLNPRDLIPWENVLFYEMCLLPNECRCSCQDRSTL